jgi:alpha-beta hydrolase superfamily lysophospholipase
VSTPYLHVDQPPVTPAAIALVLHGGRAKSTAAVRPWSLPAARMLPFVRALRHAGADQGLVVARLRYQERGWNGPAQSPVPDARWAITELAARFPGLPLGLVGHSMGGRTAMYVADEPSVVSVVGLAPWIEPGDPIDALRGRKVLIVHGDADRVTDPAASADFTSRMRPIANSAAYVSIAGGKHAMLARAGVWHELAADFTTTALFGKTENRTSDAVVANVVAKALAGQPVLAL